MINGKAKTIYRRAAVVVALALSACVGSEEFGPRHASSGREIPMPSAEFAVYAAAAEVAIAEANETIARPLEPDAVKDRAPFELTPRCGRTSDGHYTNAALLIHDLGGSPYEMRDVARAFAAACYLVRAILLPGHGTVPGDLLDAHYEQWIDATRSAVASFEGEAERVVLVGFGLGGTLAAHYALSGTPSELELGGLVLLAPALGGRAPLGRPGAPRLVYNPQSRGGSWTRLLPDLDPVRYESLPRNAYVQQRRLVGEIVAGDALLDLPVFVAISAHDAEVDPEAARDWFCRQLRGPRQMIWYGSVPAERANCEFIAERSGDAPPEIIDLSHVALPIVPDNPRYGAYSGYRECSHYYWENSPNWLICMDETKTAESAGIRYGEITPANLQTHIIRRLTWNPDFAGLIDAALDFLASSES